MRLSEQELSISIHALREEGDMGLRPEIFLLRNFYPRPPRGGRPQQRQQPTGHGRFLSTPSARRATYRANHRARGKGNFYPRPPRGGRLAPKVFNPSAVIISIHALREEGDSTVQGVQRTGNHFYPRPPRGGRRVARGKSRPASPISIHALREEGDSSAPRAVDWERNFYPRPPRGGRR